MLRTLMAAEDGEVTLVLVGPMTNTALAMRADPRICKKIKEIVIMGGGHLVNGTSPAAEFNVWVDPEAMEIVLQSGCKITIVPLDATHMAYVTAEESKRIRAIGTRPAIAVADMIEQRTVGYAKWDEEMRMRKGAPIHDALAVCAVLHPETRFVKGNFAIRHFSQQELSKCEPVPLLPLPDTDESLPDVPVGSSQ